LRQEIERVRGRERKIDAGLDRVGCVSFNRKNLVNDPTWDRNSVNFLDDGYFQQKPWEIPPDCRVGLRVAMVRAMVQTWLSADPDWKMVLASGTLPAQGQPISEQGDTMARRRFQHGMVFLRGQCKSWVGRWREDIIVEGRVRRVYKSEVLAPQKECETERLARKLLDKRLAVVNSPAYRPRPTCTLSDFILRWEGTVLPEYKNSTRPTMKGHLRKYIIPFFGDRQLQDIRAEDMQRFIHSIQCHPRTRLHIITTFRAVWNSARAWGYVAHDPFEHLKLSTPRPKPRGAFSLDQIQHLIAEAEEPLKTFLWLSAETGLRSGEVCGLKLTDVDLEHRLLHVRQSAWEGKLQDPKSEHSVRTLRLSPRLTRHLEQYLSTHPRNESGLLFSSRTGTPWNAKNLLRRKFHPLLKRLGLPKCGFHAFRHANASAMDIERVPLGVRRDRLGHANVQLLIETYTHGRSADEEKFVEAMGLKLDPESTGVIGPNWSQEVEPAGGFEPSTLGLRNRCSTD